MNDSVFVQHVT